MKPTQRRTVEAADSPPQVLQLQARAEARSSAAATLTVDRHVTIPAGIQLDGDDVDEGLLVRAVTVPWAAIVREIERDPTFLSKLDWRKMEELVAASYAELNFVQDVILTSRAGDLGRDVIVRAVLPGLGSVLWFDQVKTLRPDRVVDCEDVRAMAGVLYRDPSVSKAVITTTADFAPTVRDEWQGFIPTRMELVNGVELNQRLTDLGK